MQHQKQDLSEQSSMVEKGVIMSAPEHQAEVHYYHMVICIVLPMFQREDNRSSSDTGHKFSWVLQQDGAHLTQPALVSLASQPNRYRQHLVATTDCYPILGIIARMLTLVRHPDSVAGLSAAQNEIRAAIDPQVLVNIFDGMAARIDTCTTFREAPSS